MDAKLDDRRFVARNHLWDERPSAARVTDYESYGIRGLVDDDDWYRMHELYLDARIRRSPGRSASVLLRRDAPDTFVVDPLFADFSGALPALDLVRMQKVDTLAWLSGRSRDEVVDSLADPVALTDVLTDYNSALDARPTFAGFLEDVADLLPDTESDAPADWADQLRDILGLAHYDPPPGTSIPVVILRYPVADVVSLESLASGKPLAVPTVLDIDQFPAFCPAPPGHPVGQLVNLAATNRPPAGEILHPMMPVQSHHVFRLGHVRTSPPPLAPGRGHHLRWLIDRAGWDLRGGPDDDVLAL